MKASFLRAVTMRPEIIAAVCLLGSIVRGEGLGSVVGKTLVPLEIATEHLSCPLEAMVESALKRPRDERTLWMGTFRRFESRSANNASLEDGLNLIPNGRAECRARLYNTVSISNIDLERASISIRHLDLRVDNLGKARGKMDAGRDAMAHRADQARRNQIGCPQPGGGVVHPLWGYIPLVEPPVCRSAREEERALREAVAAMGLHSLFCPWTNIVGRPAASADVVLNCRLVPAKPSARSLAPVPSEIQRLREAANFALPAGRGLLSNSEEPPVPIASYLICGDDSGRNKLTFAVMEKYVTGMQYLCQ